MRLQEPDLPDDPNSALRAGGRGAAGLPPLLERLQEAAAARRGTAESLAALFVALLRAAGCLVRLARCSTFHRRSPFDVSFCSCAH